jgi:hypothetical protein
MSDLQIVRTAVSRAARRQRWARALRAMWLGLLAGAAGSFLLVAIYHVLPLPLWTLVLAGILPFPCMLAGLVIGGWRKPDLREVARWVDSRERLQERLSTALEIGPDPAAGMWRDLVVADAAARARQLDPRRLVQFRLPKASRWALVILALTGGLGFVPEYRSKSFLQRQAEAERIQEAGRQLTEITRRNLERRSPTIEPATQKALESARDLGDQLAKASLSRGEALKELANMAEKMKDELRRMGEDPALRKLEQAARASSGNESRTPEGLQKQIDSLQKQLGTPTGNPESLDKLKQQAENLRAQAKAMADSDSSLSDAERQKLSEALSALSKQLRQMGLQLPQLEEAINALAANQVDLFLKDLNAALTDLEKMREMAKSLQQLQQQMEKLGRDLAEQLRNGQPEAAHMTLQKMVNEMNSASLSPEQLEKILREVSAAVDPAGNYGKVAEHLKAAVSRMRAGEKPGAAQSLAAAAKELENLMQQFGDMEALSSELDALNMASMCIGTGMGWRAGNRPGFNPNGKGGGAGVGTWAGEGRPWNGEFNDHWDNSGIVRPDMDPRGHSDRPDDLNEALKPTKVRGQFSPGGQMPSITLKGLSIKGQSSVAYEEAAAAAQSDAQSALSQEKVPRAYQGAVKNYFDDLKE